MNDLLKQIMGSLDGQAIATLGQQINATPEQTEGAVNAALPVLLGMLANNCQSEQESEALARAVERDHDGGILDHVQGFFSQGETGQGMGILRHVLGSRQEPAAQELSAQTGLQGAQVTKLLALLAPLVLGALGRQSQGEGGVNAGSLGGLLQGALGGLGSQGGGGALGAQILGHLLGGNNNSAAGGSGNDSLGGLASRGADLLGSLFKR